MTAREYAIRLAQIAYSARYSTVDGASAAVARIASSASRAAWAASDAEDAATRAAEPPTITRAERAELHPESEGWTRGFLGEDGAGRKLDELSHPTLGCAIYRRGATCRAADAGPGALLTGSPGEYERLTQAEQDAWYVADRRHRQLPMAGWYPPLCAA